MSAYQRILFVIAVCLVVFGVAEIVAGGVLTVLCAALASPEAATALVEASDYSISADAFSSSGLSQEDIATACRFFLLTFFGGFISIIAGIFGMRAVRHPSKLTGFTVCNVVLLIASIVPLVFAASRPEFNVSLAILGLVSIMMQILAFVCSQKIREGVKSGQIDVDWHQKRNEERLAEGKKADLGVIRAIQVWFGICIVGSLYLCMNLISGTYEVSLSFIIMFINLVCMGISFYMIFKRYRVARIWIICVSSFNIILGTAGVLIHGDFSISERLVTCSIDIFLILYFSLAKTPREVLTVEINRESLKKDVLEAWDLWQPKKWDFWRAMIIYYCLFSIVGHWMEACYCLSIKYGLMPGTYDPTSGIWRDYLNPFPVYGAGMVACGLLLYPIKTKLQEKLGGLWKPLLGSFVVNALVCAVIELALGFLCNQDLSLWNYSDMAFNFMGQICLLNTCLFGVVATLMTWVVYPALQKLYVKMPLDIKKTMFVGILVFYAVVVCLYVINL